jgi:hypothetical protein
MAGAIAAATDPAGVVWADEQAVRVARSANAETTPIKRGSGTRGAGASERLLHVVSPNVGT